LVAQQARQQGRLPGMTQVKQRTRRGNNMAYFDADKQAWANDYDANSTPAVAPVAPVAPPAAISAPQAPPVQAGAPNPIEQASQMSDNDLALLASIRRSPGTPGVTQEQLQQQAAQGTALPQAVSSTISGANEAAYGDVQKIEEARIEAAHQQSIAEKLQANANLDNAQAASIAARQNAEAATAEQAEREAAWQQKWDQLQEQTSPENNKVDPNRFFSRVGVLGSILAVVGSIYEAKGAALGHTQNPQTVMRLIDNDIRTQQLELMQKGQAANNQLSRLSQQWGSIDAGRQALKVLQLQATEAESRNVAAQTSDPARKAQIDAQTAALDAQTAAESAKLKAIYGGQQTATQQSAVVYPRKATGGGASVDYAEYLANRTKLREQDRKDLEASGKASKESEMGPSQAAALGEIAVGEGAIIKLAKKMGLEYDEKTGEIVKPPGWSNPVGKYVDTGKTRLSSKQAKTVNTRQNSAIMLYGKPIFGNMSKDERDQAEELIKGTTPDQAPEALQSALEALQDKRRAWEGTISPQMRANAARNARAATDVNSVQPYQPKVGK
jgi:hypothetical protein